MKSFTLEKLANLLGGTPLGSIDSIITNLQDSKTCNKHAACYLKEQKFAESLSNDAGAVITSQEIAEKLKNVKNFIIVDDPYLAYAEATNIFYRNYIQENESHETIFGKDVAVGKNTVINSNCVIGDNVVIHDNVSIYSGTKIGNNSIIHSGAVIGSDGFGYAPSKQGWKKIQHLGGVEIGNHVEIGAKSTVDRGALGNTVIEDGVKIDNHVHVAHNSYIGENTAIAAQSGVAGSTKIGRNCMIGGQVGIIGHLKIGDNVKIQAQAGVTSDVESNARITGTPAIPFMNYNKSYIHFKNLPEIVKKIDKRD